MRFGVCVPNNWGIYDFHGVISVGTRAEELGFDSVWTREHLFNVGYISQRLGNKPYYEPLTVLAYLSALTTKVRLGTSVLVLPYHDPVRLAKVVATLDVASGGRITLGLGVGSMPEEYEALGVAFHERGAIANEMLEAMRVLWVDQDPVFDGKYYSFENAKFSPKPIQKPYPRLEIGGSSPAALRRVARIGAGWHPTASSPGLIQKGVEKIQANALSMGRAMDNIEVSMPINWRPDEDIGESSSGERPGLVGRSRELLVQIREYELAGVGTIILDFASDDVGFTLSAMEEFVKEVFAEL